MKKLLGLSLFLMATVASAQNVTTLQSTGSLNNVLVGKSSTSSFAEVVGAGTSYSVGAASMHGISTGSIHSRACPKMGSTSAKTGIWGSTSNYGSNVSTGGGNGGVFNTTSLIGTSIAKGSEVANVSITYPRFQQTWTGSSSVKSKSDTETGSVLSLGKNSKAGVKTNVDVISVAKSDWNIKTGAFGISDTKHVDTSGKVSTKVTSWQQGDNVLGLAGWAVGSTVEVAKAKVKAETSNQGWD